MGNDKWDKVIKYLRSSNRDPDNVLKLLQGSEKGKETNYSISRSSYALNVNRRNHTKDNGSEEQR